MDKPNNSSDAISHVIRKVSDIAAEQLRLLLETKHLYQRVSIDPGDTLQTVLAEYPSSDRPAVEKYINNELPRRRFSPSTGRLRTAPRTSGEQSIEVLCLLIGNVKLFCRSCSEREIFSPLWFRDLHNELRKPVSTSAFSIGEASKNGDIDQLFVVTYQCQRCIGELEAFLVRRRGWYLSLEGRSPMEGVESPKHIPKKERKLFREAVVAMNAGKTLAALFYLRTFIEQFARRQTGTTGVKMGGDQIMDAYSKTLPDQYRDNLPSFKVWYEQLSEAIHGARDDEPLLGEAMREIDRHFEIRNAFRIPDLAPAEKKP